MANRREEGHENIQAGYLLDHRNFHHFGGIIFFGPGSAPWLADKFDPPAYQLQILSPQDPSR